MANAALAVLPIDRRQRLRHLGHVRRRGVIQRLLHHRLFGARLAPKSRLQAGVCPQALVDFDQAMGPCQDGHTRIIPLLARRVFDRFLGDVDVVAHRSKQVQPSQG